MPGPEEWDFAAFFSTAAGVIPTLLFTLVLEKGLLPVASEFAAVFGKEVGHPSRRLVRVLFALLPQAAGTMQLAALTVRPSSMIGLAVLAEVLAFFGIAAPAAWRTNGLGLVIAFVAMGIVAFVILELLLLVALGLVTIAGSIAHSKSSPVGEDDSGQAAPEDPS